MRFTFAGKWLDDSVEQLRARAGENVEFTGWLSDDDLHATYRRAAVYVQASRHEGFGLAVAEAMLAGCVPVVMNVTAMPEVVGDAGVLIESQQPEDVADGGAPRARPRARRGPRARASASSPRSPWSAAARASCGWWKMRSMADLRTWRDLRREAPRARGDAARPRRARLRAAPAGQRAPELLQDKAIELGKVDRDVRALEDALDGR